MTLRKLRSLCESEWPTFRVSWPAEGTLDIPTVRAEYWAVTGTPGHPDQFPYIQSWFQTTNQLTPWVQFCANWQGHCRVFVAQLAPRKGKEVPKKGYPPRGPWRRVPCASALHSNCSTSPHLASSPFTRQLSTICVSMTSKSRALFEPTATLLRQPAGSTAHSPADTFMRDLRPSPDQWGWLCPARMPSPLLPTLYHYQPPQLETPHSILLRETAGNDWFFSVYFSQFIFTVYFKQYKLLLNISVCSSKNDF